ncbi:Elongator complex protein 4 [Lipomyces chichibuensis]|uniref:Elongator complex protein 4 n=1 Tax=Lipomyces chichibuensis TaxID=1546026 RepID=UPI003343C11F
MSFRKRNTPIPSNWTPPTSSPRLSAQTKAPECPQQSKFLRPSTLLPTYLAHSTGTASLDKLLMHGGQPLGTSLLVIEDAATDFASVIARCYASQGVANSDVVVAVGAGARWGVELPATVEWNKADRTARTASSQQSDRGREANDLKIAWRYRNAVSSVAHSQDSEDASYCRTWNITTRLLPPPVLQYIEPTSYSSIISQLSNIVASSNPQKIIRVVLPNFLSPTAYNPATSFAPSELLKFLMSLRALLRAYQSQLSVLITISSGLFDEPGSGNSVLLPWIENVVDGVIKIIPTPPPGTGDGDNANKYQGFIDVLKVPIVSERGGMFVRKMDYAFKVGRSGLKIEKWGIPVIIDEKADENKKDELEF